MDLSAAGITEPEMRKARLKHCNKDGTACESTYLSQAV